MAVKSFFGQALIDISERLKAQVPELKYIDQDLGQLENYDDRPPVNFPCALIDFVQANYDALAENIQLGDLICQVRLGVAPFSSGNLSAPAPVREKALGYYDIEQKIYEALQGWQPASPTTGGFEAGVYTRPFVRISHLTEHRENDRFGLRVRILSYNMGYQDNSVTENLHKHAANLKIQTDILPD